MSKKKQQSFLSNTSSFKAQLPMLFILAIIGIVGAVIFMPSVFAQRNPVIETISPSQYQEDFLKANTPHFLLDVRRPDEFATGHIAGATNISVETLATRLNQVPKDTPIVVYCRSGNRSVTASNILAEAGYTQVYDLGGIIAWQQQSFPVER